MQSICQINVQDTIFADIIHQKAYFIFVKKYLYLLL